MTSRWKLHNFLLVMWKLGIVPSEELDKWDIRKVDRWNAERSVIGVASKYKLP